MPPRLGCGAGAGAGVDTLATAPVAAGGATGGVPAGAAGLIGPHAASRAIPALEPSRRRAPLRVNRASRRVACELGGGSLRIGDSPSVSRWRSHQPRPWLAEPARAAAALLG